MRIAATALAVLVQAMVAGACTSVLPDVADGPMPAEIVILRAYSGTWTDPAERTRRADPVLAVFRDGTVVATIRPFDDPEMRGITLARVEMEELLRRLQRSGLRAVDRADGVDSGCSDCATQVIWWNGPAGFVEAAAYGLHTAIEIVPEGAPPAMVEVSTILDDLAARVARDGQPMELMLPTVPSTPISGG